MTDLSDIFDAPTKRITGHGGKRPNTGPKKAGYVKPPEAVDFDKAKARNETSKADLNELEFKIKSGQYVSRAAVQQASATAVATLAQTMRSIPDNLERKGVPLVTCRLIETILDESMSAMSMDLEMMAGSET